MRTLIHLGWALHLAESPVPTVHRHHAIQVTVSDGAQLKLLLDGSGRDGSSALGWIVGPGVPHGIDCDGPYVVLLIEPHARAARGWMERLGAEPFCALESEQARTLASEAAACWKEGAWDLAAATKLLASVPMPDAPVGPPLSDRRVRALVEQLHADPAVATPLAQLAAGVGLSESRLAHLFREEVGLPLRSFRLWLRMQRAALHIAAGASATEAAHEAGFSDSAHLSRTCQKMFGLSPSRLPEMTFPAPR